MLVVKVIPEPVGLLVAWEFRDKDCEDKEQEKKQTVAAIGMKEP